jgi:hypothetical protein
MESRRTGPTQAESARGSLARRASRPPCDCTSLRSTGAGCPRESRWRVKLTKGDNDVWEATVGPLDPGGYRYSFTVDGATVTDPRNIEMERMQVVTRSILYVPGAAFMDTRTVIQHWILLLIRFVTRRHVNVIRGAPWAEAILFSIT